MTRNIILTILGLSGGLKTYLEYSLRKLFENEFEYPIFTNPLIIALFIIVYVIRIVIFLYISFFIFIPTVRYIIKLKT